MSDTIRYREREGGNTTYAKMSSDDTERLRKSLIELSGIILENLNEFIDQYPKAFTSHNDKSPMTYLGGLLKKITETQKDGKSPKDFSIDQLDKINMIMRAFDQPEYDFVCDGPTHKLFNFGGGAK